MARALRGPNLWGGVPVLEIEVCAGPDEALALARRVLQWQRDAGARVSCAPSTPDEALALARRVLQWQRDAGASGSCAPSTPDEALALARRVLQWQRDAGASGSCAPSTPDEALALARRVLQWQQDAGARVSFAAAAPEGGRCAVEFEEEEVAREALRLAAEGADAEALEGLRRLHEKLALGPNTRALFDAARRRGIPVRRLDRGSLLQLGQGRKQRRLCGAETDLTSSIGEEIGWDKPLAKSLLQAVGVPTPTGRLVTDAADACRAAAELGGMVVVKPESANHGRSVFIGISQPSEISAAYEAARSEGESGNVLVERFIPGDEHRALLINGRVAAVARGEALSVTGDGVRSVRELMEEVNRDPRRGEAAECPLSPVGLDEVTRATLAQQGLSGGSVPGPGVRVLIQRNGNLGTDVTDQLHPANAELLALAARVIGLDIAGIDLVAADIGRPLREQGGAILEVNAMPGLLMHLKPAAGEPRRVDEMIVASLYPPGEVGRIPIVAVESGPGAAHVARLLGERLARAGFTAGVACAEGTFVQGVETRSGNCATARHAADLLLHPLLDAAVVEVRLDSIREEGLGFDRCDALVLASLEEDAAHQALRSTLPPGGALAASLEEDAARQALRSTLAPGGALAASLEEDPARQALRSTLAPGGALAASLEEDPARQALRSTLAPGGALAVARADESPEDFAARVALPFLPA